MSEQYSLLITRQQLFEAFNGNPRLIKAFEDLFKKSFIDTPTLIEGVSYSADNPFGYSELIGLLATVVEPVITTTIHDLVQQTVRDILCDYGLISQPTGPSVDLPVATPLQNSDVFVPPSEQSDLCSQPSNRVKLTGGTIDGVAIGAIMPKSGKFTDLSVSSGAIVNSTSNAGMELGAQGSSNTPYIDFHSSSSSNDYDARILAVGGNASSGNGVLNYTADGGHNFAGQITHNQPILMATSTSLTDSTGALVATLSNSPASGNPKKWITINDNGTIRNIPTW